jgi:hypothetical protein
MKRCRPHNWKLPEVGDDALVCLECGRSLDFVAELTPNMRASIVNAAERFGPGGADQFREALHAAQGAALERWEAQRRGAV